MDSPAAPHLALPIPAHIARRAAIDLGELREDLEEVSQQAHQAHTLGLSFTEAIRDPRLPALGAMHRALRDALLMEIPGELLPLMEGARMDQVGAALQAMSRELADGPSAEGSPERALAGFMVFEAVRLRLLVSAWDSEDFERVGGTEDDVDHIADRVVTALLHDPELAHEEIRPLRVMFAAASVFLASDAEARARALIHVGEDLREELRMQARLRRALRSLRLPEAVLLENALAPLLGTDRLDLSRLQSAHPLALDGLSRQAMDQRVSRGRRALRRAPAHWPVRRRPALFDLLRADLPGRDAKTPSA